MRCFSLLLVFLALPGTAAADDGGGIAMPGTDSGGMAAPTEHAPSPPLVDATTDAPSYPVPPADIGPYGPNHEPTPPAVNAVPAKPPGVARGVSPVSPTAEVVASPPRTNAVQPPLAGGLVGASSPADGVGGRGGGGVPPWLFIALAASLLLAGVAVVAVRGTARRAASTRAGAQGLHRFA